MSGSGGNNPTIGDLGERGTLARILPLLPVAAQASVPPGDDAAVSTLSRPEVVTTCDMMIEGPDFRLDWSSPHDVGWKAMASNLADVAAMGAVPSGVIVAVAASPDTPVAVLEGISRGIADALSVMAPGCGVLGGDLSASSQLTIAVTVLGDLQGRSPVLRSGAQPGDVVCATGDLGASERGLRALHRFASDHGGTIPAEIINSLRRENPDVEHHLAPVAPIGLGPVAADHGATAMMDISDGLVLDLTRLTEASGVSAELDEALIGDETALIGGEDHGLLACFPDPGNIPEGFSPIGRIVAQRPEARIFLGGEPLSLPRGGWDPYRDSVAVST